MLKDVVLGNSTARCLVVPAPEFEIPILSHRPCAQGHQDTNSYIISIQYAERVR